MQAVDRLLTLEMIAALFQTSTAIPGENAAPMPRRGSRSRTAIDSSRLITDRVIEAAWLVGLVSAPLIFNPRGWLSFYNDPKYVALHFVALGILTAWAWERALYSRPPGLPGFAEARGWVGRRPERWAIVMAGGLALTAVLSTIASPVKTVSLWGRDFTDLGYELYSFLSFLVIFFAVALRVRTDVQVRRILFAFTGVGTLVGSYAISQHYGWDPLGPGEGDARAFGSFGNPIHLGSFLVMTSVVTLALAISGNGERHPRPSYRWLAGGAVVLGVQLAALWFTGSRGPWIGVTTGGLAFMVLGAIWLDRRAVIQSFTVITTAVVIAMLITSISFPEDDAVEDVQAGVIEVADVGRNLSDLTTIFEDSPSGSVGGRGPVWESALRLPVGRPWSPDELSAAWVIRTLLGYGPEMFFYAYPLGLEIDRSGSIAEHAHNFPLQILVEFGMLGLATLLALALLVLYAGFKVLHVLRHSGEQAPWTSIVLVGLLAALIARGVEQLAGVARVGDLVPFWIMTGLIIAIVEITPTPSSNRAENVRTLPDRGGPVVVRRNAWSGAYIGVALVITLIAAGLLYFRDVRTLQASAIAKDGDAMGIEGRVNEALAKYQRAAELNPYVEEYHLVVNDLFRTAAIQAEDNGDSELARFGWESALDAAQRYADRNPKAYDSQARIGQAQSRLVALGRTDLIEDTLSTYIDMANAQPSVRDVQWFAAEGLVSIGEDTLGLAVLDRALDMETLALPDPGSWWLRGVALENLQDYESAQGAYQTALRHSVGPHLQGYVLSSHERLVVVYTALGQPNNAAAQQAIVDDF